MDLKPFNPINTKEKVDRVLDIVKHNIYADLRKVESYIILNIRNYQMQLYFKKQFEDYLNTLPRTPRKRILKSAPASINPPKNPKKNKEKKPLNEYEKLQEKKQKRKAQLKRPNSKKMSRFKIGFKVKTKLYSSGGQPGNYFKLIYT